MGAESRRWSGRRCRGRSEVDACERGGEMLPGLAGAHRNGLRRKRLDHGVCPRRWGPNHQRRIPETLKHPSTRRAARRPGHRGRACGPTGTSSTAPTTGPSPPGGTPATSGTADGGRLPRGRLRPHLWTRKARASGSLQYVQSLAAASTALHPERHVRVVNKDVEALREDFQNTGLVGDLAGAPVDGRRSRRPVHRGQPDPPARRHGRQGHVRSRGGRCRHG